VHGNAVIDPKARVGVRNNAEWCDVVCGAHGASGEFHDDIWITRAIVPRFYPNAITLNDSTPAVLTAIDQLLADHRMPRTWALKDSFAALDLTSRGFALLFESEWIYLENIEHLKPGDDIRWGSIRTAASLTEWERAWCAANRDTSSARVFLPSLLDDERVAFVAGYRGERIVAGAVANRSDGVVGWSNWFSIEPALARDAVEGSLAAIAKVFPNHPIVGYEHGEALSIVHELGFARIGRLRIWSFDGWR
jgi:hypothetical protein